MNTPTKHTPGPWFYDESMRGRLLINSERASVAVIPYLDREAQGNARLIAAAPDLLERLKQCAEVLAAEGGHEGGLWLDEIRITIAKAEGRK